jgi:hypothetical protein
MRHARFADILERLATDEIEAKRRSGRLKDVAPLPVLRAALDEWRRRQ